MCIVSEEPSQFKDYLDIFCKIATILIAAFNAYFAYKFFWFRNTKDEREKERDRNIQLLKTLVLDHNFSNFYDIFAEIEDNLKPLKRPNLTDAEKGPIDTAIGECFIALRRQFYDSLLGIDENLYEKVKDKADKLQSEISNAIFDAGVNLSHQPKYDELLIEKLINCKNNIIGDLFAYRG